MQNKQEPSFIAKHINKIITKIKAPNVAIIKMSGVIGGQNSITKSGLTLESIEPELKKAFELPRLKAVVLIINSPGGSPVQSELIYEKIKFLKNKKNIPVLAFTEDVAASGGYFIACAADEIFASENSIIGSIGVISSGFGFEEMIKKLGIKRRIYTQGKNKAVLDPFLPEQDHEIDIIKKIQKDIHESFKNIVRVNRADKLKASEEVLFNGEFWSGKQALEYGMVDHLSANIEAVLIKRFGDNVNIIKSKQSKSFVKKLIGADITNSLITNIITQIEERKLWSKFGL